MTTFHKLCTTMNTPAIALLALLAFGWLAWKGHEHVESMKVLEQYGFIQSVIHYSPAIDKGVGKGKQKPISMNQRAALMDVWFISEAELDKAADIWGRP